MKPKVSVFIATSIDGYIARKDGSIDWLDPSAESDPSGETIPPNATASPNETDPPVEDGGYSEFISTVDVLVMGRKSFEKVLSFGFWPYEKLRVFVLSSKHVDIPDNLPENVSSTSASPVDLLSTLEKEGARHIYVDGGVTIQNFLAEKLIDEITITLIPVVLGEGLPLFKDNPNDIHLKLLSSKSSDYGFVQNKYAVQTEV